MLILRCTKSLSFAVNIIYIYCSFWVVNWASSRSRHLAIAKNWKIFPALFGLCLARKKIFSDARCGNRFSMYLGHLRHDTPWFVELIKRFRMVPLSPSWDFSTKSYTRFSTLQNPVYEGILLAQQISSRCFFEKFVKWPENDSDLQIFIFSKYTIRTDPLTDESVWSHLPYDLQGHKWLEVGQKNMFFENSSKVNSNF